MKLISCKNCKKEFEEIDKWGNERTVYCSFECHLNFKRKNKEGRRVILRRFAIKRSLLGLCRQCSSKSRKGKTLCRKCALKANYISRKTHLSRVYGLTQEKFTEMLAGQGNKCKICLTSFKGKGSVHIDHDHKAKKFVRGLLCFGCNIGLGNFRDDVQRLASAIDYLKESELKRVKAS